MQKLILLLFLFSGLFSFSQNDISTQTVWRINFINPGVELELPIANYSTISTNLGVGYNGAYPELTYGGGNGFIYIIAPFLDVQFKQFYNFNKRVDKGKTISGNSGNFISARLISNGPSISENISRKSDFDFAIGPTWGIQREYGKLHLLFDVGPQFYFDIDGNTGFWPIMFQINLGLNLSSQKE